MKRTMELMAASIGADTAVKVAGYNADTMLRAIGHDLCPENRAALAEAARGFAEKIAAEALRKEWEPAPGHRDRFKAIAIDAFVRAYMAEIDRRAASTPLPGAAEGQK